MAGVRRYELRFADGKKATALDTNDRDPEELMRGVTDIFHAGYVESIEPVLPPKQEQQND